MSPDLNILAIMVIGAPICLNEKGHSAGSEIYRKAVCDRWDLEQVHADTHLCSEYSVLQFHRMPFILPDLLLSKFNVVAQSLWLRWSTHPHNMEFCPCWNESSCPWTAADKCAGRSLQDRLFAKRHNDLAKPIVEILPTIPLIPGNQSL